VNKIPRSPFNLLQEIYRSQPWKVMVCCILLNQTTRTQVDRIRGEFFRRWPTAKACSKADPAEISELIKPLGLYNRRALSIIRFSHEYISKDWTKIKELHGMGQYAQDSWDLFIDLKMVKNPSDHKLNDYVRWQKKIGFFKLTFV